MALPDVLELEGESSDVVEDKPSAAAASAAVGKGLNIDDELSLAWNLSESEQITQAHRQFDISSGGLW